MLWLKTIAVSALSIMLMGSKIIIRVPDGGQVVSSSGLYACAAGETCTINYDEINFDEMFIAIPDRGSNFSRWIDTAGSVCSSSWDPRCSNTTLDIIQDNPGRLRAYDSNRTVKVNPTFITHRTRTTDSVPRFNVRSFHSTQYYAISGNTSSELWNQLNSEVNPLPKNLTSGRKPIGHANFSYRYSYKAQYDSGGSNCTVGSAEIDLDFETVLPKLKQFSDKPNHLQTQWNRFTAVIIEHEAGHQKIYRRLVQELPHALQSVTNSPCHDLDEQVKITVSRLIATLEKASTEYDQITGPDEYSLSSL
ncbi:MAG: DUF922 domain-containing protein [Halioglobus sp.]